MNINKYFSFGSIALFILLSSDVMALDFPSTTLPGAGGGGSSTSSDVVIFSCNNANTGTSSSSNSSCSSSGSSSSSCSSTTNTGQNSVKAWEMTGNHPALKAILNNPNTTCSEAVEAVGANNCTTSGGDALTMYTCRI